MSMQLQQKKGGAVIFERMLWRCHACFPQHEIKNPNKLKSHWYFQALVSPGRLHSAETSNESAKYSPSGLFEVLIFFIKLGPKNQNEFFFNSSKRKMLYIRCREGLRGKKSTGAKRWDGEFFHMEKRLVFFFCIWLLNSFKCSFHSCRAPILIIPLSLLGLRWKRGKCSASDIFQLAREHKHQH